MGRRRGMEVRTFLRSKLLSLAARAHRLARIDYASVGIRPQDLRYAPSPAHFRAANQRLEGIDRQVAQRLTKLRQTWSKAPPDRVLFDMALVEREIDRARRAWGLFFDVLIQRGSTFAPVLAAHDVIAADCYTAIRQAAPGLFRGPLLSPLTYMEHGFSPATLRRGVVLSRLLGEANPFPLIRIPWDRDNPWQSVFLHECAHNLQADLGIWQENRAAVLKRALQASGDPVLARVYGLWHKEIFADLAALLLGGPAAAWGMAIFLAHPPPRTMTFKPASVHPTGYVRILLLAEMLRRMGFGADATRLERVWRRLYDVRSHHRMPQRLLAPVPDTVPQLVDEIAFQTRRNLGQHALADVIPFRNSDEDAIKDAARRIVGGHSPPMDMPPRHLVSASSYALSSGRINARLLSERIVTRLVEHHRPAPATLGAAQLTFAA